MRLIMNPPATALFKFYRKLKENNLEPEVR